MKIGAVLALVFGILLLIGGIITMAIFAVGSANSNFENDQNVPAGQFYTVGGKTASKIVGEFDSTLPIDVYVTTDSSATGFIYSIDSLDNIELLYEGETKGDIDYKTSSTDEEYYLMFNNPNDSSTDLHVKLEFQFEGMDMFCLVPGIIMLIIGIVLILVSVMLNKKAKREAAQYYPPQGGAPPGAGGYPPPGRDQYGQSAQYGQPGPPTEIACPSCRGPVPSGMRQCPHCGRDI